MSHNLTLFLKGVRIFRKICRNYDDSSVKVARPTLILGGGERWRENRGDFPLSEKHLFCKRKVSDFRNSYKNSPLHFRFKIAFSFVGKVMQSRENRKKNPFL
ncbi:hypothetical protein EHO98_17275 [Leptospira stimsonii]|uniref:Uncharacterized protein n=1 Tax=Leptospira stimsonii TaxID=2202203 RepID=A0ABY2MW10_9LEPT|nr:hypothetical protein EHO98_17275 [Leptospira stimsonii]TGM10028.1 hypothetical protein EHQ90_20230 [Leptospira stimsonii]